MAQPFRSWYKTARWVKMRARQLKKNPFCSDYFGDHGGSLVVANTADHIIPHKGDEVLFWDEDNLQSMCRTCHNKKTVKEEGGFGKIYDKSKAVAC